MFPFLPQQVHVEETRLKFLHLYNEVDGWLKKRKEEDESGQYQTQLDSLGAFLKGALKRLQSLLETELAATGAGEVYRVCRAYDEYMVWLRRVWNYYRIRFDQRDNPATRGILKAADEVVWSCYAGTFEGVASGEHEIKRGSAPLPFIDDYYSPQAVMRDEPPPSLVSANVDTEVLVRLNAYLDKLPIPVISLPPYCINSPWRLVLLGHEVGHQVQADFLPERELEDKFGELVKGAVAEGGSAAASRWGSWSREVFADVYSVFQMGGAALRAVAELEMSDETAMLTKRSTYPQPWVRLSLMSLTARANGVEPFPAQLGFDPNRLMDESLLRESEPALWCQVREDLLLARKIAEAVGAKPLGDFGSLTELCHWDADRFSARGSVNAWKDALLGEGSPEPELTLPAARWVVCGSFAAWEELSVTVEDFGEQKEVQERLAERTLRMLAESREEATRSAEAEPDSVGLEDLGAEFAELLTLRT